MVWPFSKFEKLEEEKRKLATEAESLRAERDEAQRRQRMAEDLNRALEAYAHSNLEYFMRPLPDNADFLYEKEQREAQRGLVGFKGTRDGLVALYIPAGARFNYAGRYGKCRAEKALVIGMVDDEHAIETLRLSSVALRECFSGTAQEETYQRSNHDHEFEYHEGEVVEPDNYDETTDECAGGIHFFFEVEEAKDWVLN